MQGFLVSLCVGLLEKLLTKGTSAFIKYMEFKQELAKNEKEAKSYQDIVNKNPSTREERRAAEDNILS